MTKKKKRSKKSQLSELVVYADKYSYELQKKMNEDILEALKKGYPVVKPKIPKKRAGRKLAKKLEKLGKKAPPKSLLKKINKKSSKRQYMEKVADSFVRFVKRTLAGYYGKEEA
jgi:hypothetical protein